MTNVKWATPTICLVLAAWLVAGGPQTPPADSLYAADASPAARQSNDTVQTNTTQPRWHDNLVQWHAISKPKGADNSFCYACHVDYEKERLTKVHLAAGVGCGTCHGDSSEHCADKDGATPPDIMFSKEHISKFCGECHAREDLLRKKVHRDAFSEENASKSQNADSQTCADCHTRKHRLLTRTRKWDKQTLKLIWNEGTPSSGSRRVGGG